LREASWSLRVPYCLVNYHQAAVDFSFSSLFLLFSIFKTPTFSNTIQSFVEHLYLQQNEGGLMNNNKNNDGAVCSLRKKYRLVNFEIDCREAVGAGKGGGGYGDGGWGWDRGVSDGATTGGILNCACCTKCYNVEDDNNIVNDNDNYFVPSAMGTIGEYIDSFWNQSDASKDAYDAEKEKVIREIISRLYYSDEDINSNIVINEPGTPQNKALLWLMFENSMNLLEHNANERVIPVHVSLEIVQRYVLAVIYFCMIGTNDKVSWIFDYGESSVCQWAGIQCGGGDGEIGGSFHVTHIDLGEQRNATTVCVFIHTKGATSF
jgi:hypothetical protein